VSLAKKFFSRLPILAAALICACQLGSDGGTEIPNEVTGSLYMPNGQPAVNAEVILYPVNYVPGNLDSAGIPVIVSTDDSGKFFLPKVASGEYNILSQITMSFGKTAKLSKASQASGASALQNASFVLLAFSDSLFISGAPQELPPDTLRAPGSLTGKVELQLQDDPRAAVVQVLGTDYYTNVDSTGNFTLNNLPQGTYELQVTPYLPNYIPLFQDVTIVSGKADTLPLPLVPFYSGIPVVTGLTAQARTDGTVLLHWNRMSYSPLQSYLIFRDTAGTLVPGSFLLGGTSDTSFVDTVYKNFRYPFGDTSTHTFEYRVRIQNPSNNLGPLWNPVTVTVTPPMVSSGRWHLAQAQAPFQARSSANAVVFQNALWVIGGQSGDSILQDAWSSADGVTWSKMTDSLPIPTSVIPLSAVVFQNKLWIMGMNNYANFLWNSADGVHWSSVTDTESFSPLLWPVLLHFQNQLWVAGGFSLFSFLPGPFSTTNLAINPIQLALSSLDGVNWNGVKYSSLDSTSLPSVGTDSGTAGVVCFKNKMWVVGGKSPFNVVGAPLNSAVSEAVQNSLDGHSWSTVITDTAFLPRFDHSLAVHDSELWVIGGYVTRTFTYYSLEVVQTALVNDVWNSADGLTWNVVDTRAPFSARIHPATVSFQGRLWVIGGENAQGPLGDIWYFE